MKLFMSTKMFIYIFKYSVKTSLELINVKLSKIMLFIDKEFIKVKILLSTIIPE